MMHQLTRELGNIQQWERKASPTRLIYNRICSLSWTQLMKCEKMPSLSCSETPCSLAIGHMAYMICLYSSTGNRFGTSLGVPFSWVEHAVNVLKELLQQNLQEEVMVEEEVEEEEAEEEEEEGRKGGGEGARRGRRERRRRKRRKRRGAAAGGGGGRKRRWWWMKRWLWSERKREGRKEERQLSL